MTLTLFKVPEDQRMLNNALFALYLLKGCMDLDQTYTQLPFGDAKNTEILKTLALFSRSQEVKNFEKIIVQTLHFTSWIKIWILTQHAQINHWEMEKYWSDFVYIDLIFKVTGGQRMLNCLVFILSPEGVDWLRPKIDMCIIWRWKDTKLHRHNIYSNMTLTFFPLSV